MAINDPRDISGLVAWYSAQAELSYADGAAMTQWKDQSGLGNHATAQGTNKPQWKAATGPSGGPAVLFPATAWNDTAGGYFDVPLAVFSGATAGEMHVGIKATGNTTQSMFHSFFNTTSDGNTFYPYTDGNIYDSFMTTVRRTITPGAALNVWRRYAARSKSGEWTATVDGTQVFTTATNTVSTPAATRQLGFTPANTGRFLGQMAVVVIYNRVLTTTERADLNTWLVANPSGGLATVTTAVPTATATAAALPVTAQGDRISVPVAPGFVVAKGFTPATTNDATITPIPAVAGGVGFTPVLTVGQLLMPVARAKAAGLSPVFTQIIVGGTDSSNAMDGRSRDGVSTGTITRPATPVPPGLTLGDKVDKVATYPTPDMIDGRAT